MKDYKIIYISKWYRGIGDFLACAKVDPEDYERVAGFSWSICTRYARHHVSYEDLGCHCKWDEKFVSRDASGNPCNHMGLKDGRLYVKMEELIMGVRKGYVIDHINGEGLDNRKCNLRFATRAQNVWNRDTGKSNRYGYKGVSKSGNKFTAKIRANGTIINLGSFLTPRDAALAYNEGALKYHGEFARLNEIAQF